MPVRFRPSRLFVLFLVVVLAATAFVAPHPARAQGVPGCPILILMYDSLFLRSGPSWGNPVTTTLATGESVCLVGRNNATTWIQVSRTTVNALGGWAPANAFWTTVPLTVLPVTDTTTPPTQPPPTTPPPTGQTYVVQAGDTVFSIARRFNVTIPALMAANNIPANYLIYIGQVLVIPGATTPPPPPQNYLTYTVQRGDYLVSIATRYGTDWWTVAVLNNIPSPYIIYAGQGLLIPRR